MAKRFVLRKNSFQFIKLNSCKLNVMLNPRPSQQIPLKLGNLIPNIGPYTHEPTVLQHMGVILAAYMRSPVIIVVEHCVVRSRNIVP